MKQYIAHKNDKGEIQTVKEHCENTAKLAESFCIEPLKEVVKVMALLHDIGKYRDDFQNMIVSGERKRVEHSICGAKEAKEKYKKSAASVSELIQLCVAGHHTGIPDCSNADDTSLEARLHHEAEGYSKYKQELTIPDIDIKKITDFLLADININDKAKRTGQLIDKYSFITRYCFSCLTDADSIDTANFCTGEKSRSLTMNTKDCFDKVNKTLSSFKCTTDLQKARSEIQSQVYEKANVDSQIYLMNMPTGSGKTLCSLKFALERVLKGKKRIIYVIPYNSIIDQTAETFSRILGDSAEILRHQSTFSYDDADCDEDYKKAAVLSSENWDAEFIITTAVQFFESVYGNKRSKLRKLHNMADSVIVFDEAHLMPIEYLKPCLQAVAYITSYLNSEAIFLTATMPDYKTLFSKICGIDVKMTDLVEDKKDFSKFKKCRFVNIGKVSDDTLLERASSSPSALIVVNTRNSARSLYKKLSGRKYHLSTYMTAHDRRRVIDEIDSELKALEKDYKDLENVPEERRITVVSTSLIEAGVDLDFHTVYREFTRLDSILQSGGRCNREGKRKDAEVFIFDFDENKGPNDRKLHVTGQIINDNSDISDSEYINRYYSSLFNSDENLIASKAMSNYCEDISLIPFKKYSEEFKLINDNTESIAVINDDKSRSLFERLEYPTTAVRRRLQEYMCSVYKSELAKLQEQHAVVNKGGVWCLTNPDYYDSDIGITFEGKDYII